MNNSIEQAAQRLEQLRRAGAQIPAEAPEGRVQPGSAAPAAPLPASAPSLPNVPVLDKPVAAPPTFQPEGRAWDTGTQSRHVHIDFARLAAAGFVTPDASRTTVAEQYRVIKRPLLDNARGRGAVPLDNGNCIMITSSLPGEGKSFTAVNLALSLAMEVDYTVMLVDADVARPSLMRVLGLPPGPGLLDLLTDPNLAMSDVLLRTNVGNLTLLPSGSPRARATELLASDAMTQLVDDMGKRYADRIIIFDSPPLLLTTESRVLATHMGQIVMVVQAEKTLQSQVKHALSTIDSCPVKLMVLNQARTLNQDAYGYGYGYGYSYGPAAASEPADHAGAGGAR